MKIEYSKEDDALYFTLKEADVADTDELTEDIIIDYDNGGNIAGIEVLDASQHVDIECLQTISLVKLLDKIDIKKLICDYR